MISQFRKPESGEFFVIGADPSEGGDYSTFVVISKKLGDVVMVGQSKEESSQLGHSLNQVGHWFNKQTGLFPMIAVERNVGSAAIYALKTLNYPNLYRMPASFTTTTEEQTDNIGWLTSSSTRPKMLDDLAMAIRQKAIVIPSKQIVDELFTFIRHVKTGKAQADTGSHDDLVMALAIAWQVYSQAETPMTDEEIQQYQPSIADKKKFRVGLF